MKYFNELIRINNELFKNQKLINNNIRISKENIAIIEDLIKKTNILNEKAKTKDKILENTLNLIAIIWSTQPFFDGNTRTVKKYMLEYLKKYNINIDITNFMIPLVFEGESVSEEKVSELKSKIRNWDFKNKWYN